MSFLGGPRACIGYRFSIIEYVPPSCYVCCSFELTISPQVESAGVYARARVRVRARRARGGHPEEVGDRPAPNPADRAREGQPDADDHPEAQAGIEGFSFCTS